jgi:hypothetical protein
MAKGNDGNYLQHSIEVSVALHLLKGSKQRTLHLAFTHGMAPFEPCETVPNGQSRRLLERTLVAAKEQPNSSEAPVVTAYRATKASLNGYPNSGELLSATIGHDRLSGGITEVDTDKHARLVEVWRG